LLKSPFHFVNVKVSKCQSVILDLVELDSDVKVVEELKLPKVQNKFCTLVDSIASILFSNFNMHMV
jgi:hypothetical protein